MSETQAIDWESRYRDKTAGWERHGINPAFLAWRDSGALAPCRILIPGGGRSLEPLALAEAGFEVTVVDAAPSAVAAQRAHFERLKLRAQVEQADLFAWDPVSPFDAVYDQTCLCALPPGLWPSYARRLHRWLRPDGTLFILFMQSDRPSGPPFHCPIEAMRRLFAAPAWRWPDTVPGLVAHPSGLTEQPAALHRR
ncbi:MAG TPA: methyltransferase domain-containing protein [Acetobacteraceae bacterium]|jgi:SAM-dependent methyltransferase|nr:methyltransferase domain-containing protein [Acetobacteraceae bacterium]